MSDKLYKFKPFSFERVKYREGTKAPKARSGHRIVSTDSDIYCFGGYNPNEDLEEDPELRADNEWQTTKPLFREFWRFSLITCEWTRLVICDKTPRELASHCAELIGDKYMFIFGGTGFPFGHTSSNKLFVLNLSTNEWNLIESNNCHQIECPVEQYGQALTTDNKNNLYVIGGTTGYAYTIDVHRFDLNSRLWHRLYKRSQLDSDDEFPPFPQQRYRHEMVFYENKLFVLGGGTSRWCYSLVKIPVFDIITNEWMEIQTRNDINVLSDTSDGYPNPRRCHDCVLVNNNVFLMGGTDGNKIFDDLWKLELNCLQWTQMSGRIPRALYFHSAAISSSGRLSVFGGVTNPNHKHRTNELFTAWLKIPALKEIAFEAILFYVNRSANQSMPQILHNLHLPLNFRQRIKQ